jgi:membrane fusion protein (multidrug efflux system)
MANPALKLTPVPAAPREVTQLPPPKARKWPPLRLRFILLVVVPVLVALGGLTLYLGGGRNITTDNAYVGAQKVLITPDVSGKIDRILVREGQRVAAGDPLFEIDRTPFNIAVTQAAARAATVRTDFANLKSNLAALERQIALARETVALKQNDVDRKSTLLASRAVSPADLDTSKATLVTVQSQLEQLTQQAAALRNQLLGNADLPIEDYPPYQLATAALDQAKRDLDHTLLRAPIAATATQVDAIQLGRYVTAGTPVFALVDDAHPWVDANPKETDITWLRVGQKVAIDVDTFPDHTFHGTVAAVSPGTGAQFAILPPQNASGNWVKVVQRVPVRVTFEPGEDLNRLRSGMSAYVSIDTGRRRSLATLLGFSAPAQEAR